ncbi:phage integrase [Bartonella henselae]|uniref:Phage integrase n=1 Tax=Bartonella henselae TaxID=38323 RepID=X5M634_BARHN|nr:phage integrase [Bartonella henselae]
MMVSVCMLNKCKDGGAQWIYPYTIHVRRHEVGFCVLRDVSLKLARELVTQWRSILR